MGVKNLLKNSVLFAVLFGSSFALAGQVTQVKAKKAVITTDGLTSAQVGDQVLALGPDGKPKALMIIRQVKGGKAIVDITRGTAIPGLTVQNRPGGSKSSLSRPVKDSDLEQPSAPLAERLEEQRMAPTNGPAWGLLGHFNMPSMDVSFAVDGRTAETKLTGTSFGFSGFYDYLITSRFQLRGIVGIDQINGTGSTALDDCGQQTTSNCDFKVMYLTMQGTARYLLTEGSTRWWIGGGGSFLLALSKSSNVLDTSQVSTNQIYSVSAGADFGLSKFSFIPVSLDYGIFPPSDTVKATMITVRAGYGWFF